MIFLNLFLINLLSTAADKNAKAGYCEAGSKSCGNELDTTSSSLNNFKMILYDVNPSEGFNLRRDVYMRFAIMLSEAHKRGRKNWHLVLPPFDKLYHWSSSESHSKPMFWGDFFDLKSLKTYPVLELSEAFEKNNKNPLLIDTLYILQNFEDPFENGVFEEKWQFLTDCEYEGNYWGYNNITAKEIVCVRFQGKISKLWELILQHRTDRIVMFMHGEIPLHDNYGSKAYWDCRKSMKFNKKLVKVATDYISKKFDCKTDKCSSYFAVHLRRRDFAYSRPRDVPSIDGAVKQIDKAVKEHTPTVEKIFIATDALNAELKELKTKLKALGYKVYVFKPSKSDLETYRDGGIAIIDQIICSHAAYFIGTHDSTFSYRIQEEREIFGFDSDTTFNRFCPDTGVCEKPSRWKIIN